MLSLQGGGNVIPLDGVKVPDFGTLLPDPLATSILAEAGARVVKVERPGRGDEMRSYEIRRDRLRGRGSSPPRSPTLAKPPPKG